MLGAPDVCRYATPLLQQPQVMYLLSLPLIEGSEVEINIVHRHGLPLLKLISALSARWRLYLDERALLLVQGGVLAV